MYFFVSYFLVSLVCSSIQKRFVKTEKKKILQWILILFKEQFVSQVNVICFSHEIYRTNMMNLVFVLLRLCCKSTWNISFSLGEYDLFKWFWINCSAFILCYWCAEHVFVFIHVSHNMAFIQTKMFLMDVLSFLIQNFFMWKHFSKQIINLLEYLPLYWYLNITFCGKLWRMWEGNLTHSYQDLIFGKHHLKC